MSNPHIRYAALALAMAAAPAMAAPGDTLPVLPVPDEPVTPEPQTSGDSTGAGVGFGAGSLLGAVVGGPVGLAVGGAVGAAFGDSVESRRERQQESEAAELARRRADRLERHLAEARDTAEQLRHAKAELDRELASRSARGDIRELSGTLAMDVLFRTDSAELDGRARERVRALASLLERYPGLVVTLAGHADRRGDAGYNLALSERRARAVRAELEDAGVAADRIRLEGYGESRAEAGPGDADGLALDRRVAIGIAPETPGEGPDMISRR